MKKRIVSMVLALSMLLALFPVQVLAVGTFTYTLDNGVTLTFDPVTGMVTDCKLGEATEVKIPAEIDGIEVTAIGDEAFSNCTYLASIEIPEGVTSIGVSAFENCTFMTSVVIPGSVTSIGNNAFYRCGSLTSIEIPEGVTSIGNNAFYRCVGLTSIKIPESVTSIEDSTFENCTGLTSVVISDSVTRIGDNAFYRCWNLTSITIPDSVISIGEYAFCDCSIMTEVIIPDSVTSIGEGAFLKCSSLTSVNIPSTMTRIEDKTFSECTNLASVTIPAGVTYIGAYAFNKTSLASVVIPEGVISIGNHAFEVCKNLTSVTLPNSITSIEAYAFNSSGLTSIELPTSVTSLGDYAFSGCNSMTAVVLPPSVTSLGTGVFSSCFALSDVTLPGTLTSIGDRTFENCTWLEHITIPNGVKILGENVFQNCENLTDVNIPDSVTDIGENAFWGCTSLTSIVIPASVTSLGKSAFLNCTSLSSVTISACLTSIESGLFYNCTALTSIEIPDSVTSIEGSAFANCMRLASVTIPSSVTSIGDEAFRACSSLNSVTIPLSVTSLGDAVFDYISIIYCYPGSEAQRYAEENGLSYQLIGTSARTLTLTVLDPDNMPVTNGFTALWYKGEACVGTGANLSGADPEATYSVELLLNSSLVGLYQQPERQTVGSEETAVTIQLTSIPTVTLTGKVADRDGHPIAGATVSAVFGSKKETATTDETGTFQIEVSYTAGEITVRKNGYYSNRTVLDLTDEIGKTYEMPAVTLTETGSDRVTLDLTMRQAARAEQQGTVQYLSSAEDLTVSVSKNGEEKVTGFEIQGLDLIFSPDTVSAGDRLSITVADPTGSYVEATETVTLDETGKGTLSLVLTQKGGFVPEDLSGPEATLLVFDETGQCVWTGTAQTGVTVTSLDAGPYRVVLLEKNSLLKSVPNLAFLGTLGLTSGKDYLLETVTVSDGIIASLRGCTVPALDVSQISVLVEENTNVTTNRPNGAYAGEMIMLRVAYELDVNKAASAEQLELILPEGIVPLKDYSVYLDGKAAAYSYADNNRQLSVPLDGRSSGTLYLYLTASEQGTYDLNPYLKLSSDGVQPLGCASLQVGANRLIVPEMVCTSRGILASGKAVPSSTVTLYDNGEKVGETTSNAAGSWSISFNLKAPNGSYSYHSIYAEIVVGNGEPVRTETSRITYHKQEITLQSITMYGPEKPVVVDFTQQTTPFYSVVPSYLNYTFQAKFSGDEVSKLQEVYVITTDIAGEKTYVETQYDADSGTWVGTHDYGSIENLPVRIGISYAFEGQWEIPHEQEVVQASEEAFLQAREEITSAMDVAAFQEAVICSEPIISEEGDAMIASVQLSYKEDGSEKETPFGSYQIRLSPLDDSVTKDALIQDGYFALDDNSEIFAKVIYTETDITQNYVDFQENLQVTEQVVLKLASPALMRTALRSVSLEDGLSATSNITVMTLSLCPPTALIGILAGTTNSVIKTLFDYQKNWTRTLDGNVSTLNRELENARWNMEVRCKDGTRALSDEQYDAVKEQIAQLDTKIGEYYRSSYEQIKNANCGSLVNTFCNAVADVALVAVSDKLTNLNPGQFSAETVAKAKLAGQNISYFSTAKTTYQGTKDTTAELLQVKLPTEQYIEVNYSMILNEIYGVSEFIREAWRECDKEPKPEPEYDFRSLTYCIDPSGFVYEAVPSNRLEGITASISEKNGDDPWNAEAYDQINPQTTGSDGVYYWDVPPGNWKVSFSGEGYVDTDTSKVSQAVNGWLPVPPPQLDIAVGMISTKAPTVEQVAVYTDRIELVFSQYMNIESVQSAVSLTRNGTSVEGINVEALNAEDDLTGANQYATRFAVIPADKDLAGSLVVSVSTAAQNYAGTAIEQPYTSDSLTTTTRPTGLRASETVSVALHDNASLYVTLQPGIANQPLQVKSLTPGLLTVTDQPVTTDANGSAVISLEGNLPGSGMVEITDPVSGLSLTVTVNVGMPGEAAKPDLQPVTAKLADGTAVTSGMSLSAGTKIYLSTQTAGAAIRYTTDDTCPCTENALVYDGPIVLSRNTVLRAASLLDGEYSATIRLELTVSGASTGSGTGGGGGGSVSTPTHTVTPPSAVENGGVSVSPKSAAQGDTVTITLQPDAGYRLETLTVTDAKGNPVTLTKQSDTEYTFVMPAGDVTVKAAFQEETTGPNPFSDVPVGAYYYDAVMWAVEQGITTGTSAVAFSPGESCTRAQAVTFLWRAAGRPAPQGAAMPFADVSDGAYYRDAVLWAVEQGITTGTGAEAFSPEETCTRGQIVTFLWRAQGTPAAAQENPFADVSAESYYYNAVLWAAAEGITTGTGAAAFSPKDDCDRSQIVTFLFRYMNQ